MFYKKVLVTGGAGFIGTNFLLYMVPRYPETTFINLDKLTNAADLTNLKEVSKRQNYFFVLGDIGNYTTVSRVMKDHVEAIVNFAAETPVAGSIVPPHDFIATNVKGCFNLLEAAREYKIKKFLQVSAAEVYGFPGSRRFYTETSPLAPDSPYAASKAAADCLVRAYAQTYGLNANITRSANNYGPCQQREKFIPTVIYKALQDQPVPVNPDSGQKGDWLFVGDHCRALETVLWRGRKGRLYNIGAEERKTGLELAGAILHILGKPTSLLKLGNVYSRHDSGYVLQNRLIKTELGWEPQNILEAALQKTVRWYAQEMALAANETTNI